MTSGFNDYAEPLPSSDLEGRLRCHSLCMKQKIATECASELTGKTTLPLVMIKGFNLCEKKKLPLLWLEGVD